MSEGGRDPVWISARLSPRVDELLGLALVLVVLVGMWLSVRNWYTVATSVALAGVLVARIVHRVRMRQKPPPASSGH
ncbi:MAG TPA: hypothetical protein VFM09_14015 [Marmoricola sp.]|nr:hypothetical protein [Marmoricola sp.]